MIKATKTQDPRPYLINQIGNTNKEEPNIVFAIMKVVFKELFFLTLKDFLASDKIVAL